MSYLLLNSIISLALLAEVADAAGQSVQHGLRVPAGFEVTEYADSQLANDIFCMTLDPKGRVVVSGRGYIRILVDDNGIGKANRAIEFADSPKDGAQGLLWEGSSLFVMGDGGLRRFRVAADGDHADGPAELIRAMKTGGEHDSHAIHRGPDGWLYVLCGNNAGIDQKFAQLPTSPIREPIAGCVLRFTPDLQSSEVVADGFRNAYGMDFNADGELFTYDSDNERCVSLPWYEPIRFYHVMPGGHYGWLSPQLAMWWRMPPYFCDVVAPVATTGRGSPTGVVCYRHLQFPARYRGGFFIADWTFGRVYFVPTRHQGSSYAGTPEVFLESVGDNGFAPTAMAVHPTTGDLYISIGGRGTRGAVYRIRHPQGLRSFSADELSALQPKPQSLDWKPELAEELPRLAASKDPHERRRALELAYRHRDRLEATVLQQVVQHSWEKSDRYIRQAAIDLLAVVRKLRASMTREAKTVEQQLICADARLASPNEYDGSQVIRSVTPFLSRADLDTETRLAAIRLIQRGLGDISAKGVKGKVWEGYSPRHADWLRYTRKELLAAMRDAFPSGDADLDRELSRTMGMLHDDDPVRFGLVASRITADSPPIDDIHYLIVFAQMRGPITSELTKRVAGALLALDEKLAKRQAQRDRHWPLRMAELYAELSQRDPNLNDALLNHPSFGRPDHVLFTQAFGFDRAKAAQVYRARAAKDSDYPWSPALVELMAFLPDEQAQPLLRKLWDRGGLEESILPLLAAHPQAADRSKFIHGLTSPQLAILRMCLEALAKLPPQKDGAEALALVRALRALPEEKEANAVREQLVKYLVQVANQENFGADKSKWSEWFAKTYPDLATRLGGADGVDVAAWNKRLAAVTWSDGDAGRGKLVFTKASCANCHSGSQALGPDLHGVANRFSRDDLMTAIIQPSKDISPRYRTTLLATADGKVYQGLIIYEAVDSVILQTGPATTARLVHQQIASRRFSDISLMPPGLMDKLTDREIADLYAYLRSLGGGPAKRRRRKRGCDKVRRRDYA